MPAHCVRLPRGRREKVVPQSGLRYSPGHWRAGACKALVAFLACLMVAMAATSVATNLARVAR
jgi:hypothetical protein